MYVQTGPQTNDKKGIDCIEQNFEHTHNFTHSMQNPPFQFFVIPLCTRLQFGECPEGMESLPGQDLNLANAGEPRCVWFQHLGSMI